MDQITSFPDGNKTVPLVIPNKLQENSFSIIIGKNGIGKSRLLKRMVQSFTKTQYFRDPTVFNQYILGNSHSPRAVS